MMTPLRTRLSLYAYAFFFDTFIATFCSTFILFMLFIIVLILIYTLNVHACHFSSFHTHQHKPIKSSRSELIPFRIRYGDLCRECDLYTLMIICTFSQIKTYPIHSIMELLSYPYCKRFRGQFTQLKIQTYRNLKKILGVVKPRAKTLYELDHIY